MKLLMVAFIITMAGIVQAFAQVSTGGLADVARQERARRASAETTDRVITTESANTNRTGAPIVVGRVVGEVAPEEADRGTAPGPEPEGEITSVELEDAAAAIAQQQRVVQELEDQEVRVQLEINRYRGQYLAPVVSQRDRDEALEGMNAAQANLEGVQARLADARETLDALVEAAEAEAAEAEGAAAEQAEVPAEQVPQDAPVPGP